MSKTIFIIEDEEDIIKLLEYNLKLEGYRVESEKNGEEGLKRIQKIKPDLLILDVMIPQMDGFEVCRNLKSNDKTKNIPILMISAKSQEHNIISGLEMGAEDYITKPFSINILIAKIRSVFRKVKERSVKNENIFIFKELKVNLNTFQLSIKNKGIKFNTTEFKLLATLISRPGWVFTRNQLIEEVMGEFHIVTDRAIDVIVVGVRKKLGSYGKYIETIRGIGYKFNNL